MFTSMHHKAQASLLYNYKTQNKVFGMSRMSGMPLLSEGRCLGAWTACVEREVVRFPVSCLVQFSPLVDLVVGWTWVTILYFHLTYSLTVGVVCAPQMTSQPFFLFFPVFHCPLGLGELQACPFPDFISQPLFLSVLFPPFTVPCKMVLARPDERETCPYHFSLCVFTMVSWSPCGPIACWI